MRRQGSSMNAPPGATVRSCDTEESLVLGRSRSYPVPICGHRRTREAALWLVSVR